MIWFDNSSMVVNTGILLKIYITIYFSMSSHVKWEGGIHQIRWGRLMQVKMVHVFWINKQKNSTVNWLIFISVEKLY